MSLSALGIEVIRKCLSQHLGAETEIGKYAVEFALQEFELYVTKDKRALDYPCEVRLPKGSNGDAAYAHAEPSLVNGKHRKNVYAPRNYKPEKSYWQVVALRADGVTLSDCAKETGFTLGQVRAACGRQGKYIRELAAIPAGQARWNYLSNVFGVGKPTQAGKK